MSETTPRPWEWHPSRDRRGLSVGRIGGGSPADDVATALRHEDAALIVAAVNAHDEGQAAIAAVARVRELCARWFSEVGPNPRWINELRDALDEAVGS